ncbi:hypothetical protein [Cupriavidus campinensis]|uniref:hypothetical protein n=1 Tax=Cupriavidus campinensis TaxID=151783 RepID=UPI0011F05FE7|nr:hypothetical protein [Cupriavidus campinensis]
MKRQLGVLISDQVSRAGILVPASELMAAEERGRIARRAQGLPAGTPTHIQHDMHRAIGWTFTLGHFIDGSMVRAIGMTDEVETDKEKADLSELAAKYWEWIRAEGGEGVKDELSEILSPRSLDGATYERIEAFAVSRPGIAVELYPELFELGRDAVDKDGLTDYRALTKRMRQLQPGVFLDPERKLVLFAHRYFRRNQSHKNKLNEYFLRSFGQTANEFIALTPRLRLDPDLLGHADSVLPLLELEHWHGPKFSDDVESIPSGSTEHKGDDRTRFFEGVDKTQFWWKSPETREEDGTEVMYRTFEVEELIDNVSAGLLGDRYACRYVHAEYSPAASAITHFDGAIRAYPALEYFERIERNIDRAGKHSEYTKLFRFDGPLPVDRWKRLLSDYFRGNPLIPEYLGASPEDFASSVKPTTSLVISDEPEELSAFIALAHDQLTSEIGIDADPAVLPNGKQMAAVETGCGAVHDYLSSKLDLSTAMAIEPVDGTLNLARLGFAASPTFPALMSEVVAGVAEALPLDVKEFGLKRVSVALSWPFGDMIVLLSLRGAPGPLISALEQLLSVIDPNEAPSKWIEPLSALVKRLAPRSTPVMDFWDVTEGLLTCRREAGTELSFRMPSQLVGKLIADGLMKAAPI